MHALFHTLSYTLQCTASLDDSSATTSTPPAHAGMQEVHPLYHGTVAHLAYKYLHMLLGAALLLLGAGLVLVLESYTASAGEDTRRRSLLAAATVAAAAATSTAAGAAAVAEACVPLGTVAAHVACEQQHAQLWGGCGRQLLQSHLQPGPGYMTHEVGA